VKQITDRTIQMIKKDRLGEQINSTLISIVIKSYVELGRAVSVAENKPDKSKYLQIYESKFLVDYLKETSRFYAVESATFIEQNAVTEYLKKAETRLDEENMRCEKYLHESSAKKIKSACEMVLIESHLVWGEII
jgi:cullin 1